MVAKNYLNQDELASLGRLVNSYLDIAEDRALRKIPMTMEDWAQRLDAFLELTDRDILRDGGKVSTDMAKAHEETEFERYRIVQDRLFESDFDLMVKQIERDDKPD
ncbi:MAG: RhuM family protein [Hydrogenophaga sp.]|nr:RhuM family protein [Hydrogenophaga sp.]